MTRPLAQRYWSASDLPVTHGPHNAPPGSSHEAARALSGEPAGAPADARSGSRLSASDQPTRVTGSRSNIPAELVPAVGAEIEGYELQEEIHRGGQGVVYRAIQLGTKRQVALKVLLEGPFASETARRRFEREVELAASLRHANIVTILDSGISHGRYFFAMEYVDGQRLDRYLAQQRPDGRQTLMLLATVCEAVNFAHQRGVIHRDLKPSNILVDTDGQPRVLDFGLAKPVHETGSNDETIQLLSITGQILGTVAYMSPEQAGGTTDVDVRSDVYSLGVVFYESLLGQPPYQVSGPLAEVLSRIAQSDPTPPRQLRARAPLGAIVGDELETILLKALEKAPARRYQTAGDLARDLRHLLAGEPIEAKRASGLYMLRKTLKRHKIEAFFAGTIFVMLIGFLIVFAVQYNKASYQKDQAELARNDARAQAAQAAAAAESERAARREADDSAQRAQSASQELRRAVVRQKIQRGDLARARGDLTLARDSYWEALEDSGGEGPALWALRQYYVETGDSGARLAALQKHGLSAVSPDGRLLAIAETDAISVIDAASGRLVQWFHSPGRASAVYVSDSRGVAAAGPGWARAWRADELQPAATAALPYSPDAAPLAVYGVGPAPWLVVIDAAHCRVYRRTGQLTDELSLRAPVGQPDFSSEAGAIALPSGAGVELVTVDEAGKLISEPIGRFGNQRNEPPRQACFSDDELNVLADTVYAAKLSGPDKGEWNPLLFTTDRWDWFDRRPGSSTIILGRRDGRVALYHGDTLQEAWRVTTGVLERGWLPRDSDETRTLDERGAVTSWGGANRTAQSRTLYSRNAVALWQSSADSSTALFADERGRVLCYCRKGASDRPIALLPPRVLSGLTGKATDGLSLALSGDGAEALVADGSVLRLIDTFREGAPRPREYRLLNASSGSVALSDDGSLAAVLIVPRAGDRQVVRIFNAASSDRPSIRPRLRRDELAPVGPGHLFMGSAVRHLAFVPGSRSLLVARSNGDLIELRPDPGLQSAGDTESSLAPPPPMATLDSPPSLMRIDRHGRRAAFMCDDRVLRWMSLETWRIEGMLELDAPATSLAFDAAGDTLLIRTDDGAASLLDLPTRELTTRWSLAPGAGLSVADWIAGDDALLMTDGEKLVEVRYDKADEQVRRNRAYARQRAVTRWLGAGDYPQAWLAAFGVLQDDSGLGRDVKEAVLETVLRRRSASVPDSWAPPILDGQPAASYARLGHAAYEGERFADALSLLRTANDLSDGALDAATLLRLAQCEYLAGNYAAADAGLAGVIERPDFDRFDLPTVQLQRAAALLLSQNVEAARRLVNQFGASDESTTRVNIAGAASARVIGRYMVGLESENVLAEGLVRLVSLADESLLYRDDIHFFLGELARARGRWDQAQYQYQRCIDLARDAWPSNWARYRLALRSLLRARF